MIHLRGASFFVYQAPDGEVEALRRVDIDIAPGEFCSVVGPSGCGKSTLLSGSLRAGATLHRRHGGGGPPPSGPSGIKSGSCPPSGISSFPGALSGQRDPGPYRHQNAPRNLAYADDCFLKRYGLSAFAGSGPPSSPAACVSDAPSSAPWLPIPKILLLDEPIFGFGFPDPPLGVLRHQPHHPPGAEDRSAGDSRHLRGHQPLRPHFRSQRPARRGEKCPRFGVLQNLVPLERRDADAFPHLFSSHMEGAGSP